MCGIFAFIRSLKHNTGAIISKEELKYWCSLIRHRGPDSTRYLDINSTTGSASALFGFHRLAINGLDDISDQPMQVKDVIMICNGEIYNYKELASKYGFLYQTHSDCEAIIHMYRTFGIERCCQELDGEFAFILYDMVSNEFYAARDHLGVRPLYIAHHENDIAFASESKALVFADKIEQFPPRTCWRQKPGEEAVFTQYF